MGAAWEEALLEELTYLIAHVAHAEQHLLELEAAAGDDKLLPVVDALRMARKEAGRVLLERLSVAGNGGGEWRSSAENLWCTIKHLAMALIHADECIEKLARRASEGDNEAKGEARRLLEARRALMEVLKGLYAVARSGGVPGVGQARCREDLCIEEEKAPQQVGGEGEVMIAPEANPGPTPRGG